MFFVMTCLLERPELKVCIDIYEKGYKVFGSVPVHGPYGLFQKKAKGHNKNRKKWDDTDDTSCGYKDGWAC